MKQNQQTIGLNTECGTNPEINNEAAPPQPLVINPAAAEILNDAQPPLAEITNDAEEASAEVSEVDQIIEQSRVDMAEEIDEGPAMLAIEDPVTGEDVPICHKDDLVTIKAGAKNGKSTLMSIFVSAMLCGQWNRVKSFIKDHRILYIDTEMKRKDTQRIGRMALTMAGMDANVNPENFCFVNLRKYGPDEIIDVMERLIARYRPTVVFIDGSLDLCRNFNDPDESEYLVKQKYLGIIDTYHCTIITAVHTNKTNDTHVSQGHLGYMLDKKGEITLECSRNKESRIITVSAPTCRHIEVPEFSFRYGKDGIPEACDEVVVKLNEQKALAKKQSKQAKDQAKKEALTGKVRALMANVGSAGIPRRQLIEQLMPILSLKDSAVQAKIKMLIEEGVLSDRGYNGNIVLVTEQQPDNE